MGGIPCNSLSQVISMDGKGAERIVPGLMAIGEAACASVHGANRLGCNALLELVVFGKSAGELAMQHIPAGGKHARLPAHALEPLLARFEDTAASRGTTRPAAIRKQLQRIMQQHAGIFRRGDLLAEGQRQLRDLWAVMQHELHVADKSRIWNNDLVEALELDNLMRQAAATLHCAGMRAESRGAHWREDFPSRDDDGWLAHSLCFVDDSGNTRHARRAVRLTAEEPKTKAPLSFPPQARAY